MFVLETKMQEGTGKAFASLRQNSSREYLQDFVREAAASLPVDALVLDAGAGDCRYKPLFSQARYESADFCQIDKEYGELTYVCDLANIPVEEGRYNLVLLTQVLEHIPEPQAVLVEVHRVLRPGGELWLSAPLFYEEHETPHDFYRYTQYGLQHLLQSAGFTVRRIGWLEGYYGTLAYQLTIAARALPLQPAEYGGALIGLAAAAAALLLKPLFLLLSQVFHRLDRREKHTSSGQCKNYAAVAVKEPVSSRSLNGKAG
jgi:SAM-dependent methyltransferase